MFRNFRLVLLLQRNCRKLVKWNEVHFPVPRTVQETFKSRVQHYVVPSDRGRKLEKAAEVDPEKYSDSDSDSDSGDVLSAAVVKGKTLSCSEWEDVTVQALAENRRLNSYNIDAIIMALCSRHKQLDTALSYLTYVTEKGRELNVATVSNFMKLCYNCQGRGVSEDYILALYRDLMSRCDVLDASTCESVTLGLCLTSEWRTGLDLINMAKVTCSPGGLEYNALAKAAFDHNESKISMELIEEMLQIGRQLRPELYHAWLDYIERVSSDNKQRWELVEGILYLLVDYDLKPTVDVAERLKTYYEATGFRGDLTFLTPRGMCKACQTYLNPIRITQDEFGLLRTSFMESVIIGKDVFNKTTPAELDEFKQFIEKTAPYDIVIDGLNSAYASGNRNTGVKIHSQTLQHVVKHFVTKSQRVLVIGRKHMQTWPRQSMDYIYKNSHVYLAQNISQDDPFLLYAALFSGLGTKFLSKDLMRGHAYLLEDKILRSTFRRWQIQHQYQIKYITKDGRVHLQFPLSFNPMAQKSADGYWHVPYLMEFTHHPPQTLDAPASWLCLSSAQRSSPATSMLA